jgi:hypothetical protein
MARLVRYRANRAGTQVLIRSEGVDRMLAGRGQSVAVVAQAAYDAHPPHSGRVEVDVLNDSASDSDRARVAVIARHPAALHIEADRRVLGGSLDAARR